LVFSDGGVLALGANVVNMALIGAALGGGLARWASGRSEGWRRWVTLGVAAWFSTVAGAMACAAELAWAGTLAWDRAWAAMLQTHALIGLGEAAITVAVVACVGERAAAVSRGRAVAGPAAAAAVVALMLSPWASVWPDGLEWVAERYAAWHSTAPAFVGPLAEYAVPGIGSAVLSTGLAGLLGVALTFGAAWGISRLWSLRGAGA
jgi:cobalt/nickel transport system permease protein